MSSQENTKKDLENLIVAFSNMAAEKEKLEQENKKLKQDLHELVDLYNVLKENIEQIKEVFLNM